MKIIILILLIICPNFCIADNNDDNLAKNMIAKSIANYSGKCACPYQVMSNGNKCGNKSAYSKPGGYAPLCYISDINDEIINKQKSVYSIRVVDGDTIVLNKEKIRLHGIDTPETKQNCKNKIGVEYGCGASATKELKKIIENKKVSCLRKDKDRYGRSVSVCYVNGKDINALLVKRGWAVAYKKYSKDYISEEAEAKKNKLGLWQGQFILPWKWRRQNR